MNYKKVNKLEETNKGYKRKLTKEKNSTKREELQLKIKINEFKIKIERLK